MLLRKRWDRVGKRHRAVRICGACRRPWPCPEERQNGRISGDEARESIRDTIAATLAPHLERARERAANPPKLKVRRLEENREII